MRRRYNEYRARRRYRRSNTSPRHRSVMTRPSVQIAVLLVAALIIYIILQSAGK